MRDDIRRVAESSNLFQLDLDFRRRGGVLAPTLYSTISTTAWRTSLSVIRAVGANAFCALQLQIIEQA
jgi:hypothetical protein